MIESDHDDDKFVDCAFAANATYIVSDDKHFDVLKEISFTQLLVLKLKRYIIVFFHIHIALLIKIVKNSRKKIGKNMK